MAHALRDTEAAWQAGREPLQMRARLASWPFATVVVAFIAAGFAALAVDLPLARWSHDIRTLSSGGAGLTQVDKPIPHSSLAVKGSKFLDNVLSRSENFAYGGSVAIILLTVLILDPSRRWAMPRLILMVGGAGIIADSAKIFLARTRPGYFDLSRNVWQTFGQVLPFLSGGRAHQSFPSAHAAVAIALAAGLTLLYPRGRWLFATFALLAFCQRIESGAHFLSDVCWGAAVGWFVAVGLGRSTLSWLGIGRWEQALWERAARGSTTSAAP